jgi:tRNA modification GTPase
MVHDTIAAIATPLVPSAIGIIRVSGPDAPRIMSLMFQCDSSQITPRQMITKTAFKSDGKPLDDCCFVFYKGPASYTGEDALEVFCHGSLFILNECLQWIISLPNCRLAKHGEFTQRAFVNGKMNLSKAESVLDIIESNSDVSHDIALSQYEGHVFKTISRIRDHCMTLLQQIEASLEFPDDVGPINDAAVASDCLSLMSDVASIIQASDYGAYVKKGITYLIVGEPNVGKSSLLNVLSGESRSIVSEIAGTTRDYIDISIQYKGVLITLIDTAGIRDTTNAIEQLGIDSIKALSTSCDGVLVMDDCQTPGQPPLPDFINADKPTIFVKNKHDLMPKHMTLSENTIPVSCKTGLGIQALKDTLVTTFIRPEDYQPKQMLCNMRQIGALRAASFHIDQANHALANGATLDVISIELRDAVNRLSDILGDHVTEELLDGIFAKFCIGK